MYATRKLRTNLILLYTQIAKILPCGPILWQYFEKHLHNSGLLAQFTEVFQIPRN